MGKIKTVDVIFMTKYLAVMLKAGLPITEAFRHIGSESKSPSIKKLTKEVIKELENGSKLSDALKKYEKSLGALYINLVRVSEESGTLEEGMFFLEGYLSRRHELEKKVKGAMTYPILVVLLAIGVGAMVVTVLLPKLMGLFKSLDVELPMSTKILIWISDTVQNHGLVILGVILATLVSLWLLGKIKQIKYIYEWIWLHTPVMGKLAYEDSVAQFTRSFGVMLKSGVPVTRALEIMEDLAKFKREKTEIRKLREGVKKGEKLGDLLLRKGSYFPSIVARMVKVGEESGNLDENLAYLADFYEQEVADLGDKMAELIEPILLLVVGLMVGWLAMAVITPMYNITGSIR